MRQLSAFSFQLSVTALVGCTVVAPPDTDVAGSQEETSTCDWPVEAYDDYRHPLQGVELVGAQVPGVDIHDSPSGKRYAIILGASQAEGQAVEHVSGVAELDVASITLSERQEKSAVGIELPAGDAPSPTKRLPELEKRLAEVAPDEPLNISVSIAHESDGGMVLQLMREIGKGRVHSFAERETVRMQLLEKRAEAVRAAIGPVRTAVEAMGGEVRPAIYQFRAGITLKAKQISDLEALPTVESVGMEDLSIEPASRQNRVREAEQVNQFVKPVQPVAVYDGYDRSAWTSPLWTVGFGEDTAPDDEHPGFLDITSGWFNVVRMIRRECNNTSCWSVSNFPTAEENNHPTSCLGLVLGDLEDGQDPNVVNLTTREERSGYSPEAWGRVYNLTGGWLPLLDDVVAASPPTPIVNSSNGGNWDMPGCLGRTALDLALNDAFEDGTLVFWAGGNDYGHAAQECTVAGPKGPGVFKVGTFGAVAGETAAQIRSAPISTCSPRGGVSYAQGRWRTLVDLVGYGNYERMFSADGAYNFQSIGGATSQATATVTGMAADLVHWFRHVGGYLPSPGELRTLLLLMGDRQREGGMSTTSFSNLWGAGRLKLRRFDESGLDQPWGWNLGQTCVHDGENVYVDLWTIPQGVDVIKAVAYWYDPRTSLAPPAGVEVPDDIDLHLQQYTSSGTWIDVKSSTSSYEPRERIYAVPEVGYYRHHRLRISGYNVTADSMGCGTDSMKVYYAYFYEDSARDDSDGPGTEVEPE